MKYAKTLSRDEMKNITAGMMAGGGGNCRIYLDNSIKTGYSGCDFSPTQAREIYENNSGVGGYCCASCGSDGFSHTKRCY